MRTRLKPRTTFLNFAFTGLPRLGPFAEFTLNEILPLRFLPFVRTQGQNDKNEGLGFQLTAMTGKKRLVMALRLSTHSIGRALAVGAEVGAAVPQGNTLNGSTANRAGLAFPVSDLEIKMGCAQLAARADISVRAGSFPGDSRAEDSPNRIMYMLNFFGG
jgi:hypothetical protein